MSPVVILFAALSRAICYLPPVDVPVERPFVEAPCAYCAGGHRGVEYLAGDGTHVRAAASGTVVFVGSVVGVRYLVVLGDDGLTATYGMLASSGPAVGHRVGAGEDIAVSGSRLYFGLRRGDMYIDPALYLGV